MINSSEFAAGDYRMFMEINRLKRELKEAQERADQWERAFKARAEYDERLKSLLKLLGENPAAVEAIENLAQQLARANARIQALEQIVSENYEQFASHSTPLGTSNITDDDSSRASQTESNHPS